MSPRTIDNMFKTPSSTTLSTLLKVCEGLDLNLNAVFHSIEIAKHLQKTDNRDSSSTSIIQLTMATPEITMYSFFQRLLIQKITQVKPWFMEHFSQKISILCMNAPLYLTLILVILQMKVPHFPSTMRELQFTHLIAKCSADLFVANMEICGSWFLTMAISITKNLPALLAVLQQPHLVVVVILRYTDSVCAICNNIQKLIPIPVHSSKVFFEYKKTYLDKKETLKELLLHDNFDPDFRRNLENYLNIATEYYALPKIH